MARIEDLRKKSILDVAHALGMELKRVGHDRYVWKEHDSFVITPSRNFFKWFSQTDKYGDVFNLVQVVREEQTGQKPSFKEVKRFLEEGTFSDVEISPIQAKSEPFHYFLEKDEHRNLELTRDFLKRQRGLSDRTINFFLRSGKIAEASYGRRGLSEPVIIFKYQDHQGQLVGAGLQGIIENREKHPERGRLKQIMKNSDGMAGFSIDIGTPERLVFAESPIDLMSYYELHRDSLKNVRLVAMDGLKEGLVSRRFAELVSELQGKTYKVDAKKTPQFLAETARLTTFFQEEDNQGLITLAVDNDEAGHHFISKLQSENIPFQIDIPPITQSGQDKEDWNDYLKKPKNVLQENLVHLYSINQKSEVAYHGYLSEELAKDQVEALTTDDTTLVYSSKQLTNKEIEENNQKGEVKMPASLDNEKAPDLSHQEQQKKERTYVHMGSSQPEAEGSPTPEAKAPFERSITSRPTVSSRYLHFNITNERKSRKTRREHSMTKQDLVKINRRGHDIQEAAQFYRDELANSTISYFTSAGSVVQVNFLEKNFMHLTGLKPLGEGQTPEKTLEDFANGGDLTYDDILISNNEAALEKIKVLPDLKVALEIDSFYFNDLQEIDRYRGKFDSLLKADDKDIMLLFRADTVDGMVPVSVFKVRNKLNQELVEANKNAIVGIYRERDGQVEEIALNRDLVLDNGEAMLQTLQELREREELKEEVDLEMRKYLTKITVDAEHLNGYKHEVKSLEELEEWYKETVRTSDQPLLTQEGSYSTFLDFHFIDSNGEEVIQSGQLDIGNKNSDYNPNRDNLTKYFEKYFDDTYVLEARRIQVQTQKDRVRKEQHFQMERERDTDGDGLANEFEQALGRNPYSPDNLTQGNPPQEEPAKEAPQKSVKELIQAMDKKGLAKVMKEGVKDYFQSDTYKKFLEAMSKFHNYSPRNIQLLLLQNPEVSHVASSRKWEKDFERIINKGEKALRIFAPITVKRRDPKTKEVLKDKNGKDMTYTSYKLVPVFDVSQTNGKELPKPAYQIEGTHQDYANLYRAAKEVAQAKGVSLEISKEDMKANGYYSLTENKIVIKAGMSEQHTLKTIFHEMAHADLHNLEKQKIEETSRTNAELQAESVAFVVASHYGFDTSSYSFAYLASWIDEPETLADLEAQITIVQKEANELVQRLDSAFEKYQNKELAKDPLAAKLEQLNEKQQQEILDKGDKENEKKSLDKENENDQPSK